jgi:hypothetical protein
MQPSDRIEMELGIKNQRLADELDNALAQVHALAFKLEWATAERDTEKLRYLDMLIDRDNLARSSKKMADELDLVKSDRYVVQNLVNRLVALVIDVVDNRLFHAPYSALLRPEHLKLFEEVMDHKEEISAMWNAADDSATH